MTSKKSKRPRDANQLAKFIVDVAAGEENDEKIVRGRLGGIVGGPARAKTLSAERRSEIARKAAAARWGKLKNN